MYTSVIKCVLRVIKCGYVYDTSLHVNVTVTCDINSKCLQALHYEQNIMSPCLVYDDRCAAMYYCETDNVYAIIDKTSTRHKFVTVNLYRPNTQAAVHGNQEVVKKILEEYPHKYVREIIRKCPNIDDIVFTEVKPYTFAAHFGWDKIKEDVFEGQAVAYKQKAGHTVYLYNTANVNVIVEIEEVRKDDYIHRVFVQPRCVDKDCGKCLPSNSVGHKCTELCEQV